MKTKSEIKEKIENIKNSDFQIEEIDYYDETCDMSNLLREALLCDSSIDYIDNISKEEKVELYNELDEVMKNKYRELNPDFSEEVLNKMTNVYKRSFIIHPMDIFVVDDLVFHKEGVYDDFGRINEINTFMLEELKPYYNISNIYFTLDDLDSSTNHHKLTREEDMLTSKFISDSINTIYEDNITKPLYELNNDRFFYGYSGIVYDECSGIDIYINKKFNEIGNSIKDKKEIDIKFGVQKGDDLILYYIHQSFRDNKPIWDVVDINEEVWRLTEEALKYDKKCNDAKTLVKK